jgi:hypothetical protein
MSPGNDNQVDSTAAATPGGERVGQELLDRTNSGRSPLEAHARHSVMDTLLGKNNLAACDAAGNDPYNTTGKFFQR